MRDEISAAIAGLLAEPSVHIDGLGYGSGTRSDLSIDIDARRGAVRFRELISPAAAVGDPLDPHPMISEYVLIGQDQYLRILQPTQDPSTPFQVLDVSTASKKLLAGAYVEGGRIFDSLDVLARLVSEVPWSATRLESRAIGGIEAAGVRAVFRTSEVVSFLSTSGMEVVGPSDHGEGTTSFELWYSHDRLVELVATGDQLHDGEVISDVAVRLTYRTSPPIKVAAPSNTVATSTR